MYEPSQTRAQTPSTSPDGTLQESAFWVQRRWHSSAFSGVLPLDEEELEEDDEG